MSGSKERKTPPRKAKSPAKVKVERNQPGRSPVKPASKKETVKVEKASASAKKREVSSDGGTNNMMRPTPEECYYATASLAVLHPHVVEMNDDRRKTLLESCGLRDSITDSVVGTMLSQNTTDKNSKQAFASLKKTFPTWAELCDCDDLGKIETSIKVAGLAKTRAERIRMVLRIVKEERGEPSLDYLRDMSDEEVKKELSRFKGLGPKTISCVLLFAMGRSEFPVDTHVLRITRDRLGWVPSSATRESAYEHLNKTVPVEVKLDLHCLLVTHGKHCHACAAKGKPQFPPKDGSKLDCPLSKSAAKAGIITHAKVKREIASPECVKSEAMTAVKVKMEADVKEEEDGCKSPKKKAKTRGAVAVKKEGY